MTICYLKISCKTVEKCYIIFTLIFFYNVSIILRHAWGCSFVTDDLAMRGTEGITLSFSDCSQAKSTCTETLHTPSCKLPPKKKNFLINTKQLIHYSKMN